MITFITLAHVSAPYCRKMYLLKSVMANCTDNTHDTHAGVQIKWIHCLLYRQSISIWQRSQSQFTSESKSIILQDIVFYSFSLGFTL